MVVSIEREARIESFEPADEEVAMVRLSGGGRIGWPESMLPTRGRAPRTAFRVTIELAATDFETGSSVDEETATLTTRLERAPGCLEGPERWYRMLAPEAGTYFGIDATEVPRALRGDDGEGYARFHLERDERATGE